MTRSPTFQREAPRTASTSPAYSSPGMSAGQPCGAEYWPRRWTRSARLSPAACTRTRMCSGRTSAAFLPPGMAGGRPGGGEIRPPPLDQVGAVEPGGVHPDPDVLRPHLRLGDIADGDDLRAARAGVDHCAHGDPDAWVGGSVS